MPDRPGALIHRDDLAAIGKISAEVAPLMFTGGVLCEPLESQIVGQVFVSPNTVKTQAQGVYRKLGVSSRGEAVEQARAAGLLDPE